jgi:hypothetical protein
MPINGKEYDWEDMSVMGPTGVLAGIKEIKYEDEQPVSAKYGKGAKPRAYGRGNYSASGTMALYRDESEKLDAHCVSTGGGNIYDHKPFTIVVGYANPDQPEIIDTLKSCKLSKKTGGGGSQGDDEVSVITYEFTILEPIQWGNNPAKGDGSLAV